jgi:hypothetical protein
MGAKSMWSFQDLIPSSLKSGPRSRAVHKEIVRRQIESLRKDNDDQKRFLDFNRVRRRLSLAFPEGAELFKEFEKLNKESDSSEQRVLILELLDAAGRLNEAREDDALEHDIERIVRQNYFGAWPFWLVIVGLSISAGFAFVGVIKLKSVTIDINETAQNALLEARTKIAEYESSVTKSIDSLQTKANQAIEDVRNQTRDDISKGVEKKRIELSERMDAKYKEIESKLDDDLKLAREKVEAARDLRVDQILNEKGTNLEERVTLLRDEVTRVEDRARFVAKAYDEILVTTSGVKGGLSDHFDGKTPQGFWGHFTAFLTNHSYLSIGIAVALVGIVGFFMGRFSKA